MASDLTRTIGTAIRQLRERAALSQEDFADLAGLHRTYIGRLERGERNASIETLARVAKALGAPLKQLLAGVRDA